MIACGTYGQYQRHIKRGEPVDDLCRGAAKEYRRAYWQDYRETHTWDPVLRRVVGPPGSMRRRNGHNRNSIPTVILDLVRALGTVTLEELPPMIDGRDATIRRQALRLLAAGQLVRTGDGLRLGGHTDE